MDPTAWTKKVKQVANQWKSMSASQKDPYIAEAASEQAMRECAAHEPFPSKLMPMPSDNATEHLCRNAKKTVSKQRALATYTRFKRAEDWNRHDGGICSADGAIQLDLIDMCAPDTAIYQQWSEYAKPALTMPQEWNNMDEAIHHSTCHSEFGHCKSTPWMKLATQYVYSMSDLVSAGTLGCSLFCRINKAKIGSDSCNLHNVTCGVPAAITLFHFLFFLG